MLEITNQTLDDAIKRNLDWFHTSGILIDDGTEGVYERAVLLRPEHHVIDNNPLLEDGLFKYRRVDCALETALAFSLCGEAINSENLTNEAQNLIDYVFKYSFQELDENNPEYGLFANGMTRLDALPDNLKSAPVVKKALGTYWNKKWVDDNSWAVILSYALKERNHDIDNERVKLCGEALLNQKELLNEYCRGSLNTPHWGGMRAMALGFMYAETNREAYKEELTSEIKNMSGKELDTSNLAYLTMQANSLRTLIGADAVSEITNNLVKRQKEDGHFPSDWWEGSQGEHISDLVYVQNWATLGLQIASMHNEKYREPFEKSLEFLLKIQNKTSSPLTNGAWQGAYDCNAGRWGGEDKKEGGPSHLYSGWTNAPILTVLAVEKLKPKNHPLAIK